MRDNMAQEASAEAEADLHRLSETGGEDDKTFAAMGVAKTISTVWPSRLINMLVINILSADHCFCR